jgi:hypothetical protein
LVSAGITRRRHEAAELPLHERGKGNRCAVFEIRADDLDTDRQTGFRTSIGAAVAGRPGVVAISGQTSWSKYGYSFPSISMCRAE